MYSYSQSCLKVLAEECHRLQVLCLQHSRDIDDVSVDILTGIKKIYRKGPLVKIVNQSDPKCAFRLVDVQSMVGSVVDSLPPELDVGRLND